MSHLFSDPGTMLLAASSLNRKCICKVEEGGGGEQCTTPLHLGGFLRPSVKFISNLHIAILLYSSLIPNQLLFSILTILSHIGKILPPLNQKGPPLGCKIRNFFGLLILIAEKKKWYFAELRFFALHSAHQNPSFELSKPTIRQFF